MRLVTSKPDQSLEEDQLGRRINGLQGTAALGHQFDTVLSVIFSWADLSWVLLLIPVSQRSNCIAHQAMKCDSGPLQIRPIQLSAQGPCSPQPLLMLLRTPLSMIFGNSLCILTQNK